MATLTVKSSARFKQFTPALLHLLVRLERLAAELTEVDELVITSANDSTHGPGSRHYTNEALDLRTHNWPSRASVRWLRRAVEEVLGPQFRALLEAEGTPNEHIHVQVKKGRTYERVPF